MSMKDIRTDIDTIDDVVIKLLEDRFALVAKLKDHKKNLTDKNREKQILSKIGSEYVRDVYEAIFNISKKSLSN